MSNDEHTKNNQARKASSWQSVVMTGAQINSLLTCHGAS